MKMPHQILLLGGSGYIGTHLLLEFHGKVIGGDQMQCVIIDNRAPHREAVKFVESKSQGLPVLFFNQDLEDKNFEKWPSFKKVPFCAIMLAAKKDVSESEVGQGRYDYLRSNILICVNSMQYLTRLGVTKLIHSSSSTVYHVDEETQTAVGVYGYSKQVSEEICRKLLTDNQKILILRYMNPIGSSKHVDAFPDVGLCSVLSKLNSEKTFINRGDCARDYIHITALASCHSYLLSNWETISCNFCTLDIGTGVSTTTDELFDLFVEVTGVKYKEKITAPRNFYESPSVFAVFNSPPSEWMPNIPLRKALEDYRRTVKI